LQALEQRGAIDAAALEQETRREVRNPRTEAPDATETRKPLLRFVVTPLVQASLDRAQSLVFEQP
jgi:hypothetical protein